MASSRLVDLLPHPHLATERVVLTPFEPSDAAAVYAYARNPRVAEHTTWNAHQSMSDAEAFIEMARGYVDDFCWAIRLEPAGPAQGAIEFGLSDDGNGAVHYVLAEEHWNRGLMTEVVGAVLDWAFEALPALEGVTTAATTANVGSRRVLEKCGFTFTGVVTETWAKHPGPVELARYTISRAEWSELRAPSR